MNEKRIDLPLTEKVIQDLHIGDRVLLSGILYTARDDAHMRLVEMIKKGEDLPFDINGACIYYVGPCPAKPGRVIGSAGPTTSGRMDSMTPILIDAGLKGMIGKGLRSVEVAESIKKNCCVYFAAIGGAGALLANHIREAEVVAFPDLGPEAIYRLSVEDFPATVVIDCYGGDLYKTGRSRFCRLPQ